jgi:hypothetical protein
MQIERSPMLNLDRQIVLGYFKDAGSRDPDVLHTHKAALVTLGRFPKLVGIYLLAMGVLLTVSIVGSFIGIPLLVLGWWMRRRGVHNLETIEEGYSDFLALPA